MSLPRILPKSIINLCLEQLRPNYTIMSSYTIKDTIPLPQAHAKIHRLGFGVYRAPAELTVSAVASALKAGYRHVDTAQAYGNEKEVGEAVRQSGIPRDEIFVTTKIFKTEGSVSANYASIKASVDKIGLGYVDLYLIHSPNMGPKGRRDIWAAMEKAVEDGLTKTIGVSNFGVKHMEEMKEYAKIYPPAVNQIEVCSYGSLDGARVIDDFCHSSMPGISNARSSPTVRRRASLLKPTVQLPATKGLTTLPLAR